MRDDGAVAVGARVLDALQRLGDRPDLIQLDEDRVRDPLFDAAVEPLDVSTEQIVADELYARRQRLGELRPAGPVVLGGAVFDRSDGVPIDPALVQRDRLLRRLRAGAALLEDVATVLKEFRR